jgi:hypothetical protein
MTAELKLEEQLDTLRCVLQIRSLQIKLEEPIEFSQSGTVHFLGTIKSYLCELELPKVRANPKDKWHCFGKFHLYVQAFEMQFSSGKQ